VGVGIVTSDRESIARLAEAMAAEFVTSLPIDQAGWIDAARKIMERLEQAG
jgi:hypothetical protein